MGLMNFWCITTILPFKINKNGPSALELGSMHTGRFFQKSKIYIPTVLEQLNWVASYFWVVNVAYIREMGWSGLH